MPECLNILIVDDEDYIRDSIKLLLEEDHCNCFEASSAADALEDSEKK